MNLFDPATLATGGIIAAIAGFWSQFKNILSQISSLIVIQSNLDPQLCFVTRQYLKRNYKVVPSGIRTYMTHIAKMAKGRWITVPFRLTAGNMIFYRGTKFLVFTGDKLVSIRGLVDVDDLIRQALLEEETMSEKREIIHTRFSVYPLIGREKGMFAGRGNGDTFAKDSSPSPSGASTNSGNTKAVLDVNIDKSFMYKRSEYVSDGTLDPFASLYFDELVNSHVEQAKKWVTMGEWYSERSIPWRRGWLLEGPGGTGKTSLSRALAEELRIPIYEYKLSTLSDQEFLQFWREMNLPCVALFEDLDSVFHLRENLTEHKLLSFDTILNAMSGVNSFSGVFTIITTNHIEKVDPALGVMSTLGGGISTRPGRIDTVIHLGEIDMAGKEKMARRILCDWPEDIQTAMTDAREFTPAQFQEMCLQLANERMKEL